MKMILLRNSGMREARMVHTLCCRFNVTGAYLEPFTKGIQEGSLLILKAWLYFGE